MSNSIARSYKVEKSNVRPSGQRSNDTSNGYQRNGGRVWVIFTRNQFFNLWIQNFPKHTRVLRILDVFAHLDVSNSHCQKSRLGVIKNCMERNPQIRTLVLGCSDPQLVFDALNAKSLDEICQKLSAERVDIVSNEVLQEV